MFIWWIATSSIVSLLFQFLLFVATISEDNLNTHRQHNLVPSHPTQISSPQPRHTTRTMSPTSLHTRDTNSSIFQNPGEKRGFIVVIILSVLATVGMFCLIITLVICKNKRDRKKRAAKMDAEKSLNFLPGRKGRYRKLEDEDEGEVWSVEMDDRRPTAYQGRYSEVC